MLNLLRYGKSGSTRRPARARRYSTGVHQWRYSATRP